MNNFRINTYYFNIKDFFKLEIQSHIFMKESNV